MRRQFQIDRAPLALFLAGSVVLCVCACAPHKQAPPVRPVKGTAAAPVPWIQSDASVFPGNGGVTLRDAANGFQLVVPAEWKANTSFAADDSGPPIAGTLRARLDQPKGACIIDVAIDVWPGSEDALRDSLPRGRELFFFAKNEEPRSSLAGAETWTATLVPLDPARIDVGYWIHTQKLLLRLEGRFRADQVGECKQELDAIVGSLAMSGDGAPKASL